MSRVNRTERRAAVSPGRERIRVLVTTDECPPNTHEARIHQFLLIKLLADNPHLINCGYSIPDRITISHNGTSWQAEAEAEVDKA